MEDVETVKRQKLQNRHLHSDYPRKILFPIKPATSEEVSPDVTVSYKKIHAT